MAGKQVSARAQELNDAGDDCAVVLVGDPGTGKSYYAAQRVRAIADSFRPRPYVLIHDTAMTVTGADVKRHASVAELEAAIRTPGKTGGVHALDVHNGLVMLAAAKKIGADSKATGGPGVVVYFDEVVVASGMSPKHIDDMVADCYAMRRHRGPMRWLVTSQYPAQAHPVLWALSTEIVIFATSKRVHVALEQNGVPDEILAKARTLQFASRLEARREGVHYVVYRKKDFRPATSV